MNTKTKNTKILNYFVKTLNGMAYGLFSTLIIGVIIRQLGILTDFQPLINLANALIELMGVGIGIGVAYSLDRSGLKLIAGAIAGGIATKIATPDPVVAYLTAILAIETVGWILKRKTPLDIILIPLLSAMISLIIVMIIGEPVATFMAYIGVVITAATTVQPFLMGIIIALVMGMLLTAPISSAAIAISIGLSGIAGGAAVVGGAVQMIGFAVMSRKDNNFGTVLSIAFGTSMLQFKNILRKPILWVPTLIVSAILGPVSTLLFKMETNYSGSGMGTSGLVGQIATIDAMGANLRVWLMILALHILLPIILVWIIDKIFRVKGWIKLGDLSLSEQKNPS
jgi:uncharacterized membrane protein